MRSHHRNQALLALGCWLFFLLLFVSTWVASKFLHKLDVSASLMTTLVLIDLICQWLCLAWCCFHLARGKGYSEAILLAAVFCPIGILVALVALLALPDKNPGSRSHQPQRRRKEESSPLEKIIRCRRNALVGNAFGFAGFTFGIFLFLFPGGTVIDPDNMRVIGIFMFIAGYGGVIAGCAWWLKAKGWSEALVFIGLMPLLILFIPFVRILLFELVPIGVVMMTLILVTIVAVLPDKSGAPRRKTRLARN
jgi:hypothetical protein